MRAAAVALAARGLVLGACGGSDGPAPRAAPGVIATPRLTADDLEVAKVNGRPVWASCVAAQARTIAAAGRTEDQRRTEAATEAITEALDQCIAFELLAQAAEVRGLGAAPEVAGATRTASVNRLVETDFEQRYRTPDDVKPLIDLAMKRKAWRVHTAPLRGSAFARFVVPSVVPSGGVPDKAPPELDTRAHALAERLATELAGETGLFGVNLTEAAQRIAAGSDVKLETNEVKPMDRDDLVDAYAAALYAIPEVGRISPAVRTPWGWDVVLWTGAAPPREISRDAIAAQIFPEARRRQFQLWVTQLGKQLGVHVEVDQATVDQLDADAGGGPP